MEVRDFSFFPKFSCNFLGYLVDFRLLLLLYSVWQCIYFFGLNLSKKYGDFLGSVGINVEFLGSAAKTMSFWPFLVQNDVVLDAITFFFLTAEQFKTTSLWTMKLI